ncbi:MAG TPA: outer membrane protein assembly factor BamE [Burkholderiales bacterium]|nr:outer membrane protein assembly factor BamE [Burkholderiales bacterium]
MAFVIAAALTALPARADPTDELARLRQEAARMRQSLDDLDARIRALENGNPDLTRPLPNAAATNPPDKQAGSSLFLLRRNWSEIQPGTSEDRVDAVLGKPERVMRINGDLVWYYVYPGLGRGSVFFDGQGKVSSVQSPHLGWSW